MSTRQKIVKLLEEVKRRIVNMDGRHSMEERLKVLKRFSQKLTGSCYSQEVRQEILKSGLTL